MGDKGEPTSFEKFAKDRGLTTTGDVDGHTHAGLGYQNTTKTHRRWYLRRAKELQEARDAAVALYEKAIADGEISRPVARTLEETALLEGERGDAARRVMEKRAARLANRTPSE